MCTFSNTETSRDKIKNVKNNIKTHFDIFDILCTQRHFYRKKLLEKKKLF